MGIVLNSLNLTINEQRVRYDSICGSDKTCTVEFTLNEDLAAPVFVYYELSNFNQNLRRMFTSRNMEQLKGVELNSTRVQSCAPVIFNKDLGSIPSIGNNFLDPNAVAYPCGGLAKAFFNGTRV